MTADHQTKNASALVESGAAELIKEGDLTGESLVRSIRHVLAHHDEMAAASKRLGFPHAAESLADLVEEVRG